METVRKAIVAVIKRFIVAVASTVGVIALFGYFLDKLEIIVHTKLYSVLGSNSVLFTAIIGTPLHETAHWLGCKLFGFQVHEVQLLRPTAYKEDGILGFVKYSYAQDSFWQRIGCVFVGIAPMIFGSLFILLTIFLLKPEILYNIKDRVSKVDSDNKDNHFFKSLWAAFAGFWTGLFSLKKWGWLRGIICLYIVCSISMHMTLSSQDIKSSVPGFGAVAIIFLVFAIITALIGTDYIVPGAKTAGFVASFLSIGLLADALLLGITLLWGGTGDFKGVGYYATPINLNKFVEITESGSDHSGELSVKFDYEKFEKKYAKRFTKKYENSLTLKIGNETIDFGELLQELGMSTFVMTSCFHPEAEKKHDLSNGDVVKIIWKYTENIEYLSEQMGVYFKYSDFDYTVKHLK